MSRHSQVKKVGSNVVLTLNQAEYKAVVVPSMLTMRQSTLKLLQEFKEAGGVVVFADKIADHVDALPSEDVAIPMAPPGSPEWPGLPS